MGKKSKGGADIIGKIPKGIWLLISFVVAMLVWTILSITPQTARCFPNAVKVLQSIGLMVERNSFRRYCKQFDFCILGIFTWLCNFRSGSVFDGMVSSGKIYLRAMDSVYQKHSTTGLRTAGSYRCRCRSYTTDYCYLSCNFLNYDSYNFPGCYQRRRNSD